jgi:hypothetical protein
VFVEQVTVRLEFLSDAVNVVFGDFNELKRITSDDIASDILLK